MNHSEFKESRKRIKRDRNREDPTGTGFTYWSLLTWERARTIRMVKACAKQVFKENFSDDHWKVHGFMSKLGKEVRARVLEDS